MGKSTFTKKIANKLLYQQANNCYCNWPTSWIHKMMAINTLGGQIIDLGSGSGITINPLQVRSFIARSEDEVDKANIKSIVNNHLKLTK
nr:hypothetical protein [Mycoplasmopsis bovis]